MTKTLKCVSPINGKVFAERETLTTEQAHKAAAEARTAQVDWSKRPLQERIDLVHAAVLKLGESIDHACRATGRAPRIPYIARR